MTPFQFDILLHYYVTPVQHRACMDFVPIWPETREWFMREGLLEESVSEHGSYRVTERGKVFLEAALNTPLPVQKWVVPE